VIDELTAVIEMKVRALKDKLAAPEAYSGRRDTVSPLPSSILVNRTSQAASW
jgi:hypothetical protein